MKILTFVFGLVLGGAVMFGGQSALAAIDMQVAGHRTLAVETAEGKFLVVAGEPVKVSTNGDMANWLYVRAFEALTRLNSIPSTVCENPHQDQINSVAAEVAEISAQASSLR